MKFIFLFALLVNITFFLWECSSDSTLPSSELTTNPSPKQILLLSEVTGIENRIPSQRATKNIHLPASTTPNKDLINIFLAKKEKPANRVTSTDKEKLMGEVEKVIPKAVVNADLASIKSLNAKKKREKTFHTEMASAEYCYQIGPFKGSKSIKQWKKRNHLTHKVTISSKKEVTEYYMVYLPAPKNKANISINMKKLKNMGIKDLWLIDRGKSKGGISLGLFSQIKSAEKVVKKFTKMGLNTKTKVKLKKTTHLYANIITKNNALKTSLSLKGKQKAMSCQEAELLGTKD